MVKVGTQQSKTKLFTRKPLSRLVSSRSRLPEKPRGVPIHKIKQEKPRGVPIHQKDIDPSEVVNQSTKAKQEKPRKSLNVEEGH